MSSIFFPLLYSALSLTVYCFGNGIIPPGLFTLYIAEIQGLGGALIPCFSPAGCIDWPASSLGVRDFFLGFIVTHLLEDYHCSIIELENDSQWLFFI